VSGECALPSGARTVLEAARSDENRRPQDRLGPSEPLESCRTSWRKGPSSACGPRRGACQQGRGPRASLPPGESARGAATEPDQGGGDTEGNCENMVSAYLQPPVTSGGILSPRVPWT